jgi:Flp pilus assembly pilin Flp
MKVSSAISRFLCKEERGQDVAEYCLITAFIVLVCLGILWHFSGGLQGMWTSINNSLTAGNAGTTSAGGLSGGS